MDIHYDLPISQASEDKFDRLQHAQRIASALASIRSDSSFVAGVYGSWGSGKTSFVNLVANELAGMGDEETRPLVVRFNSWIIEDTQSLLRTFFSELYSALNVQGGSWWSVHAKKFGDALGEYSDTISGTTSTAIAALLSLRLAPAPDAITSPISTAGGALTKKLTGEVAGKLSPSYRSLEGLREEIGSILRDGNRNVVVLIDDIDRLGTSEIKEIFKLVNLTASFPRMVYVLAFDYDVVTRALGEVQGGLGKDYLEKIVQLPIRLPIVTADQVTDMLNEVFEPYFESLEAYETNPDEQHRLNSMYRRFVLKRVDTPRRVIMYTNAFVAKYATVGEEIRPLDFIPMIAVELFCHSLSEWIVRHRGYLCGESFLTSEAKTEEAIMLQELPECATQDGIDIEDARWILEQLFPRAMSKDHTRPTSTPRKGVDGGIEDLRNLQVFYGKQVIPERVEFYNVATRMSEEEIKQSLEAFASQGQLHRLLYYLDSKTSSMVPARAAKVASGLVASAGKYDEGDSVIFGSFTYDDHLADTIRRLFLRIGSAAASDILDALPCYFDTDRTQAVMYFIKDERIAHSANNQGKKPCLTAESYKELAERFVRSVSDNVQHILEKDEVYSTFNIALALDEENGFHILDQVVDDIKKDRRMRVLYHAGLIGRWYGAGGIRYELNRPCENLTAEDIREEIDKNCWLFLLANPMLSNVVALYMLLSGEHDDNVDVTTKLVNEQIDLWRCESAQNR
ncbi:P-loop domain protein, KAP family [Atopobium sp. oral taxon 810]|uniref:KAP family P-loop NTPase fold protein n=1 Tax=Atopobium sp. oral taxon 810 TaxID=712158 RepID=UPI000397F7B4|nr:P-loop domain protein, KAP family [Atopobium sp. oral taxon 810]ERI03842.1 P-loop domain protein, KAP family [Atopobium sp. oral taxon 810 str. F0209]